MTRRTREHTDRAPLGRDEMAAVAARDIPRGAYVTLGIGQPTSVADHLDPDSAVVLHTENGMLGMGPVATGDLANWHTGDPDAIPAVGGAMDLAIGAKQVFVMMTLFTKDGTPKLVRGCTYPLTGVGCVDRLYTDLAVFELHGDGVVVTETFGTSVDELARRLDLPLRTLEDVGTLG